MTPLSVMIKPASGACSLNCRYCFYADEMSPRRMVSYGLMDESTLENVIHQALDAANGMCSISRKDLIKQAIILPAAFAALLYGGGYLLQFFCNYDLWQAAPRPYGMINGL